MSESMHTLAGSHTLTTVAAVQRAFSFRSFTRGLLPPSRPVVCSRIACSTPLSPQLVTAPSLPYALHSSHYPILSYHIILYYIK